MYYSFGPSSRACLETALRVRDEQLLHLDAVHEDHANRPPLPQPLDDACLVVVAEQSLRPEGHICTARAANSYQCSQQESAMYERISAGEPAHFQLSSEQEFRCKTIG